MYTGSETKRKEDFIKAFCWSYGVTKKEALKTYKKVKDEGRFEYINLIIEGYYSNVKSLFNND